MAGNADIYFSHIDNKGAKTVGLSNYFFNPFSVEIIGGVVQDKNGQPISGVSVQVKGTAVGTTTNERGEFRINANRTSVLVISSTGYQTREVLIQELSTGMVIVLEESFNDMEEVIVVGYGTMRRKDVTGAISSINEDEL